MQISQTNKPRSSLAQKILENSKKTLGKHSTKVQKSQESPKEKTYKQSKVVEAKNPKPTVHHKTPQNKAWTWKIHKNQPYGIITFKNTVSYQKIRIIPLDGVIFGDPQHDSEKFIQVIKKIANEPNTFCFLNGDIFDIRKKMQLDGGESQKNIEDLTVLMRPILGKVLWAQQGCLERRSETLYGFDPLEYFCSENDIPYFREPVYIDIWWNGKLWTLWAIHGMSNAKNRGSKMNFLRELSQMHEWTNFIVRGHVGDSMWNRTIKICRNPIEGKLVHREEFHIILGSFKKYLGSPRSQLGQQPSSGETTILCIHNDGKYSIATHNTGR